MSTRQPHNFKNRLLSFNLTLILVLVASALALSFQPLTVVNAQDLFWARQLGGAANDISSSISLAVSSGVYSAGAFAGTVDFDPGLGTFNLTSAGGNDFFVVKFDDNGNFLWAKRWGNTGADDNIVIAVDAVGAVYAVGNFVGTTDFDPGTGTFNLTSLGNPDTYVSKLDNNGNFIWAKQFGGAGSFIASLDLALDGSGNIQVAGHFAGTVDFDPGPSTFNLTGFAEDSLWDVFVTKLDSNGSFIWAKMWGSNETYETAYDLEVDASGNVYTVGDLLGTVDFDPGPGIFNLTGASVNNYGHFVSKLDSNGNFVWARAWDGTGLSGIAVDGPGNVYLTGSFDGTTDVDPNAGIFNLTSAGLSDAFVSKLDGNGNFVWAKRLGGSGDDGAGSESAVDVSGNIHFAGDFSGTADFDPGASTFNLTSVGFENTFLAVLTKNGDFGGARQMSGDRIPIFTGLVVDGSGNEYISGAFSGTVDFDSGPDTFTLTSLGSDDFFIAKLGPASAPTPTPTPTNTPTPSPTPTPAPSPLLNNLVSYWKMDEAGGTRADSHSTNSLADINTVAPAAGKINSAGLFNAASSEYLRRADNAALSTGNINFTISAWVYQASKTAVMPIISKSVGAANSQIEYSLDYLQSSNRYRFTVSNGTSSKTVLATTAPVLNTWTFLVAWHDADNNQVCISGNNGTPTCAAYSAGAQDSTFSFEIGRGYGSAFWNGRIDEVGFWKRVLTASERDLLFYFGNGFSYPFQ